MADPAAIELTVNGASKAVAAQSTVSMLLETLEIKPERVVVEVNLKILKRHEHSMTKLQKGDQVEIVRFVGGGASSGLRKLGAVVCERGLGARTV